MSRILLVAAATIISASTAQPVTAFAQSAQTKAKGLEARSIPVKRAFQFYDIYTGLPAQDRDGFRVSYRLRIPQGAPRLQLVYALGSTRIPIELAADGTVINMPSAAMYANGTIEVPAGQGRMGIELDLDPVIPLNPTIPVASVSNALYDYRAALRRAGPLSAFAPKLEAIRFVGGAGGQAVYGDGRRVPLMLAAEGGVLFKPSAPANRGVVSLVFGAVPISATYAR